MYSEYELVFYPRGSRVSQVIMASPEDSLSTIRNEDDDLKDYYFLNKEEKIINKKFEGNYKLSQIARENRQIIMAKKQDVKEVKKIQKQEFYEIYLNFQNENRKEVIKVKATTTLQEVQQESPETEGYSFLNKEKVAIKPNQLQKYTVKEVQEGNNITLRKKEQDKSKGEEKFYIIQFKDSKQGKISVHVSQKQIIANLRKNSELAEFYFLNTKGEKIAETSESKLSIKDICNKDIICMKPKHEGKTNTKEYREKQQKRIESLGKLMDNVKSLQGNINKEGNSERMKEISQQLKEHGVHLEPAQLSDQHSISSLISTLRGKEMAYENMIQYAKKNESTDAENFASNGLILPTVYKSAKKQHQTQSIIDFQKTKKTRQDKYKQGRQLSIIQYEASQTSTVTVDIAKTSTYEFKGGSLNVSAFFVSSKNEVGKTQLHENQNITTKRGVSKNEKINQLFLAFSITHAIYFHQNDIFLKRDIVQRFQEIVEEYKDSKNVNLLRSQLNQFIDRYGIGIKSGMYFLGGVYKNTINYEFFTEKTSDEVTNIIRTETQFSLGNSLGVSYGKFSAQGAYHQQDKKTTQNSSLNSTTTSSTNYRTTFYHEANPLSSIQDIKLWRETIEAFPNNWVVVGYDPPTQISIISLLGSRNNCGSFGEEFLEVKRKVLRVMRDCIHFTAFQFQANSKFQIDGNQVRKCSEPYQQCQILSKNPFPKQSISSYTVQITKSKSMQIALGVCSPSCKKHQYSRPEYHQVIYYRLAGRGSIEYQKQTLKPGTCVKEGAQVQVVVEMGSISFVSWLVEGKVVGKVRIPEEMVAKGVYGYFQVLEVGDSIRVIG